MSFSYSDFNRATISSPAKSRSGVSSVGVAVAVGVRFLGVVILVLGGVVDFLAGVVDFLAGVVDFFGVGDLLGVAFLVAFLVSLLREGVALHFGGVGLNFGGIGLFPGSLLAPPFIKKSNKELSSIYLHNTL